MPPPPVQNMNEEGATTISSNNDMAGIQNGGEPGAAAGQGEGIENDLKNNIKAIFLIVIRNLYM